MPSDTVTPRLQNWKYNGVSPETRCEYHRHRQLFHWKRGVVTQSVVSSETWCEYQLNHHVFHRKRGVGQLTWMVDCEVSAILSSTVAYPLESVGKTVYEGVD